MPPRDCCPRERARDAVQHRFPVDPTVRVRLPRVTARLCANQEMLRAGWAVLFAALIASCLGAALARASAPVQSLPSASGGVWLRPGASFSSSPASRAGQQVRLM